MISFFSFQQSSRGRKTMITFKRLPILLVFALCGAGVLFAAQIKKLTVAIEDRPEVRTITDLTSDFEKANGAQVEYLFYPSGELRSKIRLDASMGTGQFNVIYITEASVAEQASNNWVVPLAKYYPTKFDFNDFLPSIRKILSYNTIAYAAPINAETTWLAYRKDVFSQKGIAVPKTLDEYIKVCQMFHGENNLYGGVVRGDRGHGFNVWRWTQFFVTCGGKYMENGKWVFDKYLDQAVTATKYYMAVIKTSPPGGEKFSYLDAWDSFNAGQVATFICASPKYAVTEDPQKSTVAGKVGYAPPPYSINKVASGAAHGLAISSVGSKSEEMKVLGGKFIAWATSKEMEIRRVQAGQLNVSRQSTFKSTEFNTKFPPDHVKALEDTLKITQLCIPVIPEWPEIGDNLGIILEELFVGTRTDIRGGLQEAADKAKEILKI
jgi:multiple sugar transport system substrate-binding protein